MISAADPLNLVGILTSHERVTSNASNRIALLDGIPVAALVAREVRYLVEPTDQLRGLLENGRILVRHGRPAHDDESPCANGEEHTPPNGTSAAEAKQRAQRSLFPHTIPRPIVR